MLGCVGSVAKPGAPSGLGRFGAYGFRGIRVVYGHNRIFLPQPQ